MGRTSIAAAVAAGMAMGLGGVVAADLATQEAEAQGDFSVTPGQLRINQRISQAAVRRANQNREDIAALQAAAGSGGAGAAASVSPGPKGAQGPAGPAGPQGAPGAPGPAGPTAGVSASTSVRGSFPERQGTIGRPVTVTTPASGRLFVSVNVTGRIFCEATGSSMYVWVVLDDETPVTTSLNRTSGAGGPLTVAGVTDGVVPAGAHTMHVATACVTGASLGTSGIPEGQASAVVLGG